MKIFHFSLSLICAVLLSACVSSDKYNDERQLAMFLKDSMERAKGRNRQLQVYIDDHIEQYHAGQGLVVPSEMFADTEIRNLRMEINRLRREVDEKNHIIWDLTKKGNDPKPSPSPNTNTTSVNPPPRPNLNKDNSGSLDNLNVDSARGIKKRK